MASFDPAASLSLIEPTLATRSGSRS